MIAHSLVLVLMAVELLQLLCVEQRQPASDQHMPCERHVRYIRRSDRNTRRGLIRFRFKNSPLPDHHVVAALVAAGVFLILHSAPGKVCETCMRDPCSS